MRGCAGKREIRQSDSGKHGYIARIHVEKPRRWWQHSSFFELIARGFVDTNKMAFMSKIKLVALIGFVLSLLSLLAHLLIARVSNVDVTYYSTMNDFNADFPPDSGKQSIRYKKLWGAVTNLEALQPYANPRGPYYVSTDESNGFLYAKIHGGFSHIRSSICDLVAVSRLLNATLVLPEIEDITISKGISSKSQSFSYLYNEDQFIASLRNDVAVVKRLPENLKASKELNEFPFFKPNNSASPDYFFSEILPALKKVKVVRLRLTEGGCLKSILPPEMSEYQRLRCRVAFHALHFRPEIHLLGNRIIQRLRAWGQPFLSFHPGLMRNRLAYHGCAELFQDIHTELIQYKRAWMIKHHIIRDELSVDSHLRRENGLCPLMPEEVGIMLRAMGYPQKTVIYLAGSETFGGQRVILPLRAMFPMSVDRSFVCSKQELLELLGNETPISSESHIYNKKKQPEDEQSKDELRPRPLPPPPARPTYQHEKEGWYGWVTETYTEPDPSQSDLRMQAHRLLWDALDYIVSVEADAFFPGFNNDGSGWPDFSSLVMGHRTYGSASLRTYRPDRKVVAKLFNNASGNMYHLNHNWTVSVQEHLRSSLGEDGLVRNSMESKPMSFLSHPLPECSCIISPNSEEGDTKKKMKENKTNSSSTDEWYLYEGEEKCPQWMHDSVKAEASGVSSSNKDSRATAGLPDVDQEPDFSAYGGETDPSVDAGEGDDEMDPND